MTKRACVMAAASAVFTLVATTQVSSATDAGTLSEPEPLGKIFGVTRTSKGAVTVDLTPEEHDKGSLTVAIKVNTHTVNDLDKYDLKKLTSLEFDGKRIAPGSAPKLKGHHNSGELVFSLKTLPKAFTIKIRDFDQPKLRVFSWP